MIQAQRRQCHPTSVYVGWWWTTQVEFEETNQLCDNEGNSAVGRRGLTAKQAVVLCRSVMLHTRAASLTIVVL